MEKGLIFDLDGTLWDSVEQIRLAWSIARRSFFGYGDDLDTALTQAQMGRNIFQIARTLSLKELDEDGYNRFANALFDSEVFFLKDHPGSVYPNTVRTLTRLKELGYHLFLVSNCLKGYAECFIDAIGGDGIFEDRLCFGDTNKEKAFNIALIMQRNGLDKAFYIGDTRHDKEEAEKAGASFIHAAYGFGKDVEAAYSIGSIEQVVPLLQEIDK